MVKVDRKEYLQKLKNKENYVNEYPLTWWKGHLYIKVLQENSKFIKGRVFDLGSNYGYFTHLFPNEHSEVIGIDLNREALKKGVNLKLSGNKEFVNAIGSSLPFKTGSFDSGFAFQILEHLSWEDAVIVLCEVRRILKDKGYLLIAVPRIFERDPIHHLLDFKYASKIMSLVENRFELLSLNLERRMNPNQTGVHNSWNILLRNKK